MTTVINPPEFTLEAVIELTEKLVEEQPDFRNPYDPSEQACLYTDPENDAEHCIAGAVFAHLGAAMPYGNDLADDTADAERFEWKALQFLRILQEFADGRDSHAFNDRDVAADPEGWGRRTWRAALIKAKQSFAARFPDTVLEAQR